MERAGIAVGCFVVFGGLAIVMGRSAMADWREGRQAKDKAVMFYALQEWWPTVLSAAVAVVVPVGLLLGWE